MRSPARLALTAAVVVLGACGSSGPSGGTPHASASASGSPSPSSVDVAAATVAAAAVPGLGTVLVNGFGHTYYVLSSESGGRITCTDDNGCTEVWPDSELPTGIPAPIPGSGIDRSMLSTVKATDKGIYTTYAGYPLYTYKGDEAAGQAKGQGVVSFGGTWEAMRPDGTPVTGRPGQP